MLQFQEISSSSGTQLPVDPRVLSTLTSWRVPKHPRQSPRFRSQVEKLCSQLETPPRVELTGISFTEDEDRLSQNKEDLQIHLEFIRSILTFVEGAMFERIKRQVRDCTPYLSRKLTNAAQNATLALRDSEQTLLFLLDSPVDDEWLPEPAPSNSFNKESDAIPLDAI